MRRRTIPLALGALALAAMLGAGCVTPSIPIPPPDPTAMTFSVMVDVDGTSLASLTYAPDANYIGGVAYVYNRDRGLGIIQAVNANGSIGPTTPVLATVGEQIVVSVENDEQTVSTCIRLREGVQDATSYCN